MREILNDWRLHWFVLLLPVALFLPAMPIDETRYLSVAWEMHFSDDYLVPHLNGATYSDKPILLFWMINFAWLFVGMQVWIVRLGVLVASLGSLVLFELLVRKLDSDIALARRAVILLSGILFFALFSSAIMFDVLLTTCVLIALHGVLDLDAQQWRRGTAVFALGIGLGILAKGPVVLLHAGLVAVLAPWWSTTAREQKARWYRMVLLGMLGGALIGLAWAVPAAIYGGKEYAYKIFLGQTVGRVAHSFAHARPLWWYFIVLPLMLLPWPLSVRAPWRAWRNSLAASKGARFAFAWFVPAFIVFCLVSGKQPQYLLPLLPALALYLATVLGKADAYLRGHCFGGLLLVVGVILFVLPYLAAHADTLAWMDTLAREGNQSSARAVIAGIWPLWGALLFLLGAFLLAHPRAYARVPAVALVSSAAAMLSMLAIAQGVGPTVDVSGTAARIRAMQDAGQPIAHLAWHHGLFEFSGRLTKPLEKVDFADLYTWCAAHPDGEVLSIYTKYPIAAKPELEIPYRFGRILFWRAADLCAAPRAAPPIKPDDDDTSDD